MPLEADSHRKNWQVAQRKLRANGEACAFVYVHLEADTGLPFYVGIGENPSRPWNRRHHSRTEFHRNIVEKHGLRVHIVADHLLWDEACFWEMSWISVFRKQGYRLANLTDGGDGTTGLPAHNRRGVLCLETGELFDSATTAGRHFGLSNVTVSDVCRGTYRLAKPVLHFVYADSRMAKEDRLRLIREIELKLAARRKKVEFNKSFHGIIEGRDVLGRSAAGPARNCRKVLSVTDGITFPSASAAARHYNVSKSAVIELCLGKNNRRTVGGIVFQYMEGK